MNDLGIWRTIKIGFWLGVGFIIPQLIVIYSGTFLTFLAMPSMMEESVEDNFFSQMEKSSLIKLVEYREEHNGNQLLILGSIANEGSENARSIRLEAELFDAEGAFVFECTEYINKKLEPGDNENFQISCGCGENATPEHSSITVRVVSASSF